MNYQELYDELISFRRENLLQKGNHNHNHHIKPRCFFTKDQLEEQEHPDNLIYLRPNEHFKAHLYLFLIYENTNKKHKCEEMFNSFKLTLDHVRKYDVDYIEECSLLYEENLNKYYSILKEKTIRRINEICDFIDKFEKIPRHNINNKNSILQENEKYLGNFLSDIKKEFNYRNGNMYWTDDYIEIINNRGYPNLFKIYTEEDKEIERINELIEFINSNNRFPRKDILNEKTLYNKLQTLRTKNNNNKLSSSSKELLIKKDYWEIFSNENWFNEKQVFDNLDRIFIFIDKNKKLPSKNKFDEYEDKLGKCIQNYNARIKKNKFKEKYKIYIKEKGYLNYFKYLNN